MLEKYLIDKNTLDAAKLPTDDESLQEIIKQLKQNSSVIYIQGNISNEEIKKLIIHNKEKQEADPMTQKLQAVEDFDQFTKCIGEIDIISSGGSNYTGKEYAEMMKKLFNKETVIDYLMITRKYKIRQIFIKFHTQKKVDAAENSTVNIMTSLGKEARQDEDSLKKVALIKENLCKQEETDDSSYIAAPKKNKRVTLSEEKTVYLFEKDPDEVIVAETVQTDVTQADEDSHNKKLKPTPTATIQ